MVDALKTIVNAVTLRLNTLAEKIGILSERLDIRAVQADWNQNDPKSPDYVKNRPFYDHEDGTVIKVPEKYLNTHCVSYQKPQGLNLSQKETARNNIGAGTSNFDGQYTSLIGRPTIYTDIVRYNVSQALSATQKSNVRKNIGASAEIPAVAGTGQYSIKANDTVNGYANGDYSFSHGAYSSASGKYSYAGGNHCTVDTNASAAHAEGTDCKANANASHAEGFAAIAASPGQHVQGKFNIQDADSIYAHIVGNGTDESNRSNAHTLDWSGNAWFAGTVEGTGMIVKSSTSGSSKRFKITVDDSGAISAVEI